MRPFFSALFTALCLMLFNSFVVAAPDIKELQTLFPQLQKHDIQQFMETGQLHRYFYRGESALYEPTLPVNTKHDFVPPQTPNFEPNLSVEIVYFLPLEGLTLADIKEPNNPQILAIYNTLRSISTLTGVKYYSESRKKMRTLFEAAYAIDNIDTKTKIPDPVVNSIPSLDEILVFQHDLTFGKNVSLATYQCSENIIRLSINNLTDMKYAFLPFVRQGNMQTSLTLIPKNGGVYLYGNIQAKTLSLMGLEKKKQASFYNRLTTLLVWFKNNVKIE